MCNFMRRCTENQRISSRCESYVKLKNVGNALLFEYELFPLDIYVSKKHIISKCLTYVNMPCESFVKQAVVSNHF